MHFASSSIFIEIDTIWTVKWVGGRKRKRARKKYRKVYKCREGGRVAKWITVTFYQGHF